MWHGVKFGVGSIVDIEGRLTILLTCKISENQTLNGVYLILRITTNIVSLGQLNESGYQILINDGVL